MLIPKYLRVSHRKFILDFKRDYASTKKAIEDSTIKLRKIDEEEQNELKKLNSKYNSSRDDEIRQLTARVTAITKTINNLKNKHSKRLCSFGNCSCNDKIHNLEYTLNLCHSRLNSLTDINAASKEHVDAADIKRKYSEKRNEVLTGNDMAIAMNGLVDKYAAKVEGIGLTIQERMERINSRSNILLLKMKNFDLVMNSDNASIAKSVYDRDLDHARKDLGLIDKTKEELKEAREREKAYEREKKESREFYLEATKAKNTYTYNSNSTSSHTNVKVTVEHSYP